MIRLRNPGLSFENTRTNFPSLPIAFLILYQKKSEIVRTLFSHGGCFLFFLSRHPSDRSSPWACQTV